VSANRKKARVATGSEFILVSARPAGMRAFQPKVKVDVLSDNVNIFLNQMNSVLEKAPENIAQFRFTEFSVSVEVTAKGELSILGSGAGVEAKGGLTFKFVRK
jgi:hypothetical protein